MALTVPASARVTEPYWHRAGEGGRYTFDADAPFGLPYRPTPFTAQIALGFEDAQGAIDVSAALPVQFRYEGNIFSGEKRSELLVVPALSVRTSPEILILPSAAGAPPAPGAASGTSSRPGSAREIRVTVVNGMPGKSEGSVALALPPHWTSTPQRAPVTFTREDEAQTVRFVIGPPAGAAPGAYEIRASVASGSQSFARGYQVIEYPHIRRQHIYQDAATRLKLIDVKTAPNLTVGYVMGVGDGVPAAIAQLGATVELIDAEELAWGGLARFDVILTGVRAYEARPDLRANNERLLQYVRDGGTVIVQYNKYEFNEAQYGPYPAKVSSDRVTDEQAPVILLEPSHPVFSTPNRIGDATWRGWVQERGLYFLGERAPQYRDLVRLADPFPFNTGEKRGALVEATYGKGRWLYVGLGLWRELPAGVDGAYQLLANLISLGKSSPAQANP